MWGPAATDLGWVVMPHHCSGAASSSICTDQSHHDLGRVLHHFQPVQDQLPVAEVEKPAAKWPPAPAARSRGSLQCAHPGGTAPGCAERQQRFYGVRLRAQRVLAYHRSLSRGRFICFCGDDGRIQSAACSRKVGSHARLAGEESSLY